jgi:putative membrane protein
VHVRSFVGALEAAVFIGVLNAVLPPIVASVRLPFTLVSGFLLVLALDAAILLIISALDPADFKVDSFGDALLAALLISAASLVLQVIIGVNDDDVYSLRVIARVARRQGSGSGPTPRGSCISRSTGSRPRSCAEQCVTATHP